LSRRKFEGSRRAVVLIRLSAPHRRASKIREIAWKQSAVSCALILVLAASSPGLAACNPTSGQSFSVGQRNEARVRHHALFAEQIAGLINVRAQNDEFAKLSIMAPVRLLGPAPKRD
jgi:hypothetical protein